MDYKFELFENLKRTARLQATTLSVIVCCLFILLTLFMVQSNLDKIFSAWTQNLKVSAYLSENIGEEETKKLIHNIKENQSVEEVHFISKEEYKKEFDEKLIQIMPKLTALKSIQNPFQNGLEIKLEKFTKISGLGAYLEEVAEKIGKNTGIEDVTYGKIWINEYSRLSSFISYASIFIIIALLISISFIIGNAVKTLLDNRKKEIHILSILGATKTTIFMPFYLNVALLLGTGFVLSIVISMIFKTFAESLFSSHLSLLSINIHFPGFFSLMFLFLFICIFAFLGTHLHLMRINNNRYNI